MKLLITLDFPPAIGGIQTYLEGIVRFRYNHGDLVWVGGVSSRKSPTDNISATIRYFTTPFDGMNRKFSLLALLRPFMALCRKNNGPDTIECGTIYAAIVPWILSGVINRPYCIYTYGTELVALTRRSLKNRVLKKVLLKAGHIFTLGDYSEKLLRSLSVTCPIERVAPRIVLPVPSEQKPKQTHDDFRILSVGRLVPHKGHSNLVRAAAILVREKKYSFTIIGNGPQLSTLRELCKSLCMEKYFTILHDCANDQRATAYREANLFVLPSLETPGGTEGFGIVLLEAMSYRLPVLASACGGIPEVLDQGNCGVLVQPGSINALTDGIRRIADNPSLGTNLAEKAYERVKKYYAWN